MTTRRGWGAALVELDRVFDSAESARDGRRATDAVLLDRFVHQRDESAFAALVDRHGPMVLHTARGIVGSPDDADDVFQATFLTLARRARAVRSGASVAPWLHQVARRAAIRALSRRRRTTGSTRATLNAATTDPDRLAAPAGPDPDRAEADQLLHAEIDHLPTSFGQAVILCDLEGLTRDEAAERLGWPAGTVASRLARGRRLLRERLTRRLGGADAWLGAGPGARSTPLPPLAPLPPVLIARLRAAAASGLVQPTIADRLRVAVPGVSPIGWASGALGLVLVTAVALGGTVAVRGRWLPGPPPPVGNAPPAVNQHPRHSTDLGLDLGLPSATGLDRLPGPSPWDDATRVVAQGRVVDAGGVPVVGAEVALVGGDSREPTANTNAQAHAHATTQTDAAGRFTLTNAVDAWPPGEGPSLLVTAPGFGPSVVRVDPNEAHEVSLQAPAPPIRGQVAWPPTLPAQAGFASARFRPLALLEPRADSPAAAETLATLSRNHAAGLGVEPGWVAAEWRVAVAGLRLAQIVSVAPGEPAQSEFVVTGLGSTSVLLGAIEGPGLATQLALIAARLPVAAESDPSAAALAADQPTWLVGVGDHFRHEAAPAQPLRGLIRAEATGLPIAGATVAVTDALTALGLPPRVQAQSDAAGRFALDGLGAEEAIGVEVRPPGDDPHLGVGRRVAAQMGSRAPGDEEFRLRRGAWVTGQVVDGASARPRDARIDAFTHRDEPTAQPIQAGDWPLATTARTDAAGWFRLRVASGPGWLAATTDDLRDPVGIGTEARALADLPRVAGGALATAPTLLVPRLVNTMVAIDPSRAGLAGAATIAIAPAAPLRGVVVGPDGAVVRSGVVGWNLATNGPPVPVVEGQFAVLGLVPGRPRRVYFRHDAAQLVGSVVVVGGSAEPVTVQLGPWASYGLGVGDSSGHPSAGPLRATLCDGDADGNADPLLDERQSVRPPLRDRLLPDGRHEVSGFDPGLTYDLRFESPTLGAIPILDRIRLRAGQRESRGFYVVRADGISAL